MCQLRLADRAWLCVGRETESNLAIFAPDDIGFEKPLRRLFIETDAVGHRTLPNQPDARAILGAIINLAIDQQRVARIEELARPQTRPAPARRALIACILRLDHAIGEIVARVAITGAIAFDGIDHGTIGASILLSWVVQGSSSSARLD
jgi:hypothetical protein